MELFEVIHTRRSIRSFSAEPVSEADLEAVLRAAMAAPSAGNEQPWHFVVVTDRSVLEAIPNFHPYAAMCKKAPAAIVVAPNWPWRNIRATGCSTARPRRRT